MHSFQADQACFGFRLNNYEIAFFGEYDDYFFDDKVAISITSYNYKTTNAKKSEIRLKANEFKRLLDSNQDLDQYFLRFIGLNDNFVFIRATGGGVYSSILFLLNREDGNSFFKYFVDNLCN